MLVIISLAVFLLTFILGSYECIPRRIEGIILLLCIAMLFICVIIKPKYSGRKLSCSCKLLPIIDGVYAIKTCKNKFLCRYVDLEDGNKIKIDLISVKTEVDFVSKLEIPTLYLYERKSRSRYLLLDTNPNIYEAVLSVPEGSILSE